jgi:hypothetical protein
VRNFAEVEKWVNENPHKINYYLLPFSHGFKPSHTALMCVCSNQYMSDRAKLVAFLLSRGASVHLVTRCVLLSVHLLFYFFIFFLLSCLIHSFSQFFEVYLLFAFISASCSSFLAI